MIPTEAVQQLRAQLNTDEPVVSVSRQALEEVLNFVEYGGDLPDIDDDEPSASLIEKYGRAQLGIDGNCGFALLGPNLQEGEAEFVEIERQFTSDVDNQLVATKKALWKLRERLDLPELNFYFGESHPYGD